MINNPKYNYVIRKNRRLKRTNSRGPPGVGFKLTEDGNYDILLNKLTNVNDPEHEDDAVNLKTLIKKLSELNLNNDIKLSELRDDLQNENDKYKEFYDENNRLKFVELIGGKIQKNLLRERLEVNRQFIKTKLNFPSINQNFSFNNQSSKTISLDNIEIITDGIIEIRENLFKPKRFVYFLKITFLIIENEKIKKQIESAWFSTIYPHEGVTKYLRPAFGENTDMLALYSVKDGLEVVCDIKRKENKMAALEAINFECIILFEAFFIT